MRKDSSFCAKSVRYNIFTNGAQYCWLHGVRYSMLTHDEMQRSVKCTQLNRRRGLKEVVRGVAVKRQTSEKSKPNDIGVSVNKLRKYKKRAFLPMLRYFHVL